MGDIIDFAKAKEEREPHVAGQLYCQGCDHEWAAVWKPGTTEFECPSCHAMRGRNKYDVLPPAGAEIWSCTHCRNERFVLTRDCVLCPGCGQQWNYGDLE